MNDFDHIIILEVFSNIVVFFFLRCGFLWCFDFIMMMSELRFGGVVVVIINHSVFFLVDIVV